MRVLKFSVVQKLKRKDFGHTCRSTMQLNSNAFIDYM